MAMSKADRRTWPHNGQPSRRHVMKETWTHPTNGNYASKCQRCGRSFNAFADTRAPVYCYPTGEWLAANPSDDGKTG